MSILNSLTIAAPHLPLCPCQPQQPARTYCIAHGTLLNVMWQHGWDGSLVENGYMYIYGVWGRMVTCICMAKSLHCSPETITTLLISYTPMQNKKLKKVEHFCLSKTLPDHVKS